MKVEQLMTRPVVTCGIKEDANRAAQLMWEEDLGCVVVLDEAQRLVGVVTDRDLCMAAYTRGVPLTQIPLAEVMSTEVAAVHHDDVLGMAEALMRTKQVRRLPVLNAEGTLVGLISLSDVVREAHDQRGRRSPDVAGDEVVSTLGAITQPRKPYPPEASA